MTGQASKASSSAAAGTVADGPSLALELPLGHGMAERPARVPLADGGSLIGNLIVAAEDSGSERAGSPRAAAPPVAVLFLHGWSGIRGGPHNLFTAFARGLAADGIPSLRFDFRGRGESSGPQADATLDTMGEDALAAARYLQSAAGTRKLIVVGICSGGNVAIGVRDRLPDMAGLFLLSVYPFTDGDSFGRSARRSLHYVREYGRKLFMASTWKRLVSGRIDLGGVAGVILGQFRKRDAAKADPSAPPSAAPATSSPADTAPAPGAKAAATTPGGAPTKPAGHQASPLRHLLAAPLPLQMIYGDTDPDYADSIAYFQSFMDEHNYPITFTSIAGANHNFYALAWKQDLLQRLRTFLSELTP